jgi:putative membrane protein
MIVWTKAIHITALTVWCAGLLLLPVIYARRAGLRGDPLHELHRLARTLFISITSPAAFVAVVTGTLLIFLRDVFTVWMALKLVAVGVLVVLHVRQGYIILHLFDPGRSYARWRQYLAVGSTASAIVAVLLLVLAKPVIDIASPAMLRPGGLQSLLETMIPMP